MDELQRLPSLTRLALAYCNIPACLPALSRLQQLQLALREVGSNADNVVAVGEALRQLQQLTCLVGVALHPPCCACFVTDTRRTIPTPLPSDLQVLTGVQPDVSALAGLSRLQRCCLALDSDDDGAPDPPLPPGPWLASLRWLRANVDTLVSNTGVLQGATALERLEAGEPYAMRYNWRPPAVTAFFRWLAQHPPLQRVCFGGEHPTAPHAPSVYDSTAFARRLQLLAHRRPALQLLRMYNARDPTSLLGTVLAQ